MFLYGARGDKNHTGNCTKMMRTLAIIENKYQQYRHPDTDI